MVNGILRILKGRYTPSDAVVGLSALARYQTAEELGSPGAAVPHNPDAQQPQRRSYTDWTTRQTTDVFNSEEDRQWAMTLNRRAGKAIPDGHTYVVKPQ